MGTPLFSLVHCTTRLTPGKPFYWADTMAAWGERCDNSVRVEYVLCVDAEQTMGLDVAPEHYKHQLIGEMVWGKWQTVMNTGRRCAVDAWNTAAASSTGEIIITVADDYFPPEHWDTGIFKLIREECANRGYVDHLPEFVLDVDNQDGSEPLLPFSFISRAYYNRLGYLFWPEYYGIGADCDFTEVARRDGVVIDARHLKFEHRHWGRGLREMDEVDRHQQSAEAEEAHHRVLARRRAEGFPPLKKP